MNTLTELEENENEATYRKFLSYRNKKTRARGDKIEEKDSNG